MTDRKISILDFETTGLIKAQDDPSAQPGIVQIGLITLDGDLNVLQEINQLINPECYFEEKAQQITGISPDDLHKMPNFKEFWPDFSPALLGCTDIIYFNGEYDMTIMWWQAIRYGLQYRVPWPLRHHDLMKIAKDVLNIQGKQDRKYPSLVELHESLFGHKFADAHDALADCKATLKCALELKSRGLLRL